MRPVTFECPVDITKAYEEQGRWIVEGYAATSDFDMQEDIITEDAIRTSAKDLLENSTVLHNHNPDEAIGRVLTSKARSGGLFLKILISKTAGEIWQQVREGVLNKFSVRGKILEARKEWVERLKKFARLILKMRLVEVSLVAVPANPKARAIRWYVEKALDDFETAGGSLETMKGGSEMNETVVIQEELLEATGELCKDAEPAQGVFALDTPENESGPAAVGAGSAPSASRLLELVDQLLSAEKDEGRKTTLTQIRALVTGSSNPSAPARNEKADAQQPDRPAGAPATSVEKAGRKISTSRLARLKKLLEELTGFIDEVEVLPEREKKAAEGGKPPDKLTETVGNLAKRLEALEQAPGLRTSLDGQEALAGEQGSTSVWKGLV